MYFLLIVRWNEVKEQQSKAISSLKVRKLLMRKVSLKYGEKGRSDLLQKLITKAIEINKNKEERKQMSRYENMAYF